MMVFKWAPGECMVRMYQAAHRRFMQLPVQQRLDVFDTVMEFILHVNDSGYVAIDFYDGSIMYDHQQKKTTICDIDLFRTMPCINDMGRMWGSAKFMSPEEYELGAQLDGVTNVYTLGAMAFALFGNYERTPDTWQLSRELYEVAARAVQPRREDRYSSAEEFMLCWRQAKKEN